MGDALFQSPYREPVPDWLLEQFGVKSGEEYVAPLFPRGLDMWNGVKLSDKHESKMTGVERITQERLEQKIKHNKSVKGDWEQYPDFELAQMAEALLTGDKGKIAVHWSTLMVDKMFSKSYEERLVLAGALIAAQIDVLNFKE